MLLPVIAPFRSAWKCATQRLRSRVIKGESDDGGLDEFCEFRPTGQPTQQPEPATLHHCPKLRVLSGKLLTGRTGTSGHHTIISDSARRSTSHADDPTSYNLGNCSPPARGSRPTRSSAQ